MFKFLGFCSSRSFKWNLITLGEGLVCWQELKILNLEHVCSSIKYNHIDTPSISTYLAREIKLFCWYRHKNNIRLDPWDFQYSNNDMHL